MPTIKSKTETPSGEVSHIASTSQSNSGLTIIKLESRLGQMVHSHSVTAGEIRGRDATKVMTDDEIAASLQATLNSVRQEAANVLHDRARVARLVGSLI